MWYQEPATVDDISRHTVEWAKENDLVTPVSTELVLPVGGAIRQDDQGSDFTIIIDYLVGLEPGGRGAELLFADTTQRPLAPHRADDRDHATRDGRRSG